MEQTTAELGELFTALSKTQGEIKVITKDSKANLGSFSYKYTSLEAIIQMAKPIWTKHGLCILQPAVGGEKGMMGVETMICHGSGQMISWMAAMATEGSSVTSAAQDAGKVISYLRRYELCGILQIPMEDDDAAKKDAEDAFETVTDKGTKVDEVESVKELYGPDKTSGSNNKIPNKHPGKCYRCHESVEAQKGYIENIEKKWEVFHHECEDAKIPF